MKTFGALFFVVLAIILINVYGTYGPGGVTAWLSAKFLNRPHPELRLDKTASQKRAVAPKSTGAQRVSVGGW
jgi:hypothetical protein